MFLQASVILLTGGGVSASVHAGIPHTPLWEQTPPKQTHRLEQTPTPGSRHPPQEQTPPGAGTPPRADTPSREQTPPEQTPPGCRHPPQRRACWERQSTRGRYASYWNAILLILFSCLYVSEFHLRFPV